MTREEKLAAFRELTKLADVQVGSELESAKVRILIESVSIRDTSGRERQEFYSAMRFHALL